MSTPGGEREMAKICEHFKAQELEK